VSRHRRTHRDERGSGTVLMAAIMSVVVLLGAAATMVAGYLVSHHQARSAADLAALSGAAVYAQGAGACDQARRTARQNGAQVTRCDQVGDEVDFVVTVRVRVSVRVRSPGLPRQVEAEAHAGRVG
jgi:secretion/DNA translocation related TadE-like protein